MNNIHFPHYSSLEHLTSKVALYNQQQAAIQDCLLDRLTHYAKLALLTPNDSRISAQRKYLLALYNQIK